MRINNVSTETSSRTVVVMSFIVSVITFALVWGYMATSYGKVSFFGFFEWLFNMFPAMRAEMSQDPFGPLFILIFFIGSYVGFIIAFVKRYKALARFNSELNIRYINLLPEGIAFCFNRPECNFKCSYGEVENLFMDINSQLVRTKNGYYIAFQQLNLVFTTKNGHKYKLSNTTSSPMETIYKIIDQTRKVQKFEYDFSGYGEIPDYKEKIDEYLHLGYKDIIGRSSERNLKLLSIIFFIIGTIPMIPFLDTTSGSTNFLDMVLILFPFLILLIISFVLDIILVIDKIRDDKYRGYNG